MKLKNQAIIFSIKIYQFYSNNLSLNWFSEILPAKIWVDFPISQCPQLKTGRIFASGPGRNRPARTCNVLAAISAIPR